MALIGQEITLKRLRRINSECIELEPESTNPKHRSIRIDAHAEDVEIVGVILGPSWESPGHPTERGPGRRPERPNAARGRGHLGVNQPGGVSDV